jgi:hypothetical protein
MGLFGSSATTTSTTPWQPAQQYIKTGMSEAQKLYQSGQGYNAPNFNTSVQMSDPTKQGLATLSAVAAGGNPLAQSSKDVVQSQLSGAMAGNYNSLYNAAGGVNADVASQYQNLGNAAAQGYGQLASNAVANATGLTNQYAALQSQFDNPHYQAAVQNQSDQIANDVQRQFSGLGRYGSAANTGALTDQLGKFREQAMSDQWNQNNQNQMAAVGAKAGLAQQALANQQSLYGAGAQTQMEALGARSGLAQQQYANKQSALGQQGQAQLAAVQASPGVYEQMQAGGKLQGQIGQAYDDQATRDMQAKLDAYNANQQAGWNRLNAYSGTIGQGGGGQSGYGTSSVQQPSNLFGSALGGALAGGKLGGGYGAAAGGLLGMLSNYF